MKKFSLMLILLGFVAVLVSCSDDDDDDGGTNNTTMNIVETAQATDDLSTLVAALQRADLVSALEGDGPFTVFAPTNDAFQALLDSDDDWNTLEDIPTDLLTNVLLFHVVNGEVRAADLSDTYANTLATGPDGQNLSLQIQVTGGVEFNGSASPTTTDIETSNGVVHVIDEVMLPKDIVQLALSNDNFSTLVSALTRSDLPVDLVSTLSLPGPYTVFAPTNDAFAALLDSNDDWNTLDDIPVQTLVAVLSYHVVNGANVQSDQLQNNQVIETYAGPNATLTVDLSDGVKLGTTSGQSVEVIIPDVQGTNGVIHAVNQVLIP